MRVTQTSAIPFALALMCATALSGCGGSPDAADLTSGRANTLLGRASPRGTSLPSDLEGQLRQVQTLRAAARYPEATRLVSQLMLVSPDDPRVVGEYGKLLAAQGRSDDALAFLSRAVELSPEDWSSWSAMGVANDQKSDYDAARIAYDRALALRPDDAGVLNNYALSRLLAHDGAGAARLAARASDIDRDDPRIRKTIALVQEYAPAHAAIAVAAAPAPARQMAATPAAAPIVPVTRAPLSLAPAHAATGAPVALTNGASANAAPANAAPRVVMQAVPHDPLAGPVRSISVKPAPVKTAAGAKPARKAVKAASETPAAQAAKPAAAASPAPVSARPKTITAQKDAAQKPAPKAVAQKDAGSGPRVQLTIRPVFDPAQIPSLRRVADASKP